MSVEIWTPGEGAVSVVRYSAVLVVQLQTAPRLCKFDWQTQVYNHDAGVPDMTFVPDRLIPIRMDEGEQINLQHCCQLIRYAPRIRVKRTILLN